MFILNRSDPECLLVLCTVELCTHTNILYLFIDYRVITVTHTVVKHNKMFFSLTAVADWLLIQHCDTVKYKHDKHTMHTSSYPLLCVFSRDDVLVWLNESLLPRLLDDSALLRDTGSVLLGTLRLRQIRDMQGEIALQSLFLLCCELAWSQISE